MKPEIRWEKTGDTDSNASLTKRGVTLVIGGEVAAVVSMCHADRNMPLRATADIRPLALRHPKALHVFTIQALAIATELGTTSLLAVADRSIASSERWLKRLGFEPVGEVEEGAIYLWKPHSRLQYRQADKSLVASLA